MAVVGLVETTAVVDVLAYVTELAMVVIVFVVTKLVDVISEFVDGNAKVDVVGEMEVE